MVWSLLPLGWQTMTRRLKRAVNLHPEGKAWPPERQGIQYMRLNVCAALIPRILQALLAMLSTSPTCAVFPFVFSHHSTRNQAVCILNPN